ncbi:ATP-binding protein [Moraxella bovis]|uniref:ATP-binding protein n=1 Tax=Moraxella bovis TaxID=476 RepID=UPI000DC7AED0|nr:ATP-binding protein [Moraxella bovis]AWY20320.1 ATP-binding protein [Moraxella bovis]UZA15762.1 ATP-binding protein [Moraxella bovis]
MAIGVFVLGHSGSGKSFSLKNLDPNNVGFINVVGKFLPFRGANFRQLVSDDPFLIIETLRRSIAPIIVIDDFQYLMSNKFMRDSDIKGFDKYTQNGKNIWQILNTINYEMKPYQRVYILSHTDEVDGKTKLKTIGKLLDEKITPEGMVGIVLQTHIENGKHFFLTQNNGFTTVKTPFEMFDDELIPNDLEFVDNAICEYYNLPKTLEQEQ